MSTQEYVRQLLARDAQLRSTAVSAMSTISPSFGFRAPADLPPVAKPCNLSR